LYALARTFGSCVPESTSLENALKQWRRRAMRHSPPTRRKSATSVRIDSDPFDIFLRNLNLNRVLTAARILTIQLQIVHRASSRLCELRISQVRRNNNYGESLAFGSKRA
jgi:hypothetical protein